jgi:hypothetical protein
MTTNAIGADVIQKGDCLDDRPVKASVHESRTDDPGTMSTAEVDVPWGDVQLAVATEQPA